MKIVRFAGGLGNTMFQYALYLQVCKLFPNEKIYIDTIWYEFTGYPFELPWMFNIEFNNNFYYFFTENYGIDLTSKLDELRFWKKYELEFVPCGLAHPAVFMQLNYSELPALYSEIYPNMKIVSNLSMSIKNFESYLQEGNKILSKREKMLDTVKDLLSNNHGVFLQFLCAIYRKSGRKRMAHQLLHFQRPDLCRFPDLDRINIEGDVYYNLYGSPMDCNGIYEKLLNAFTFPKLDEKNLDIKEEIIHSNAVAIHARVTSFQYGMGTLLNRGYYQKAVNYINNSQKEKMKYFIFSDNIDWCKENLGELGLQEKDDIIWVEGNTGDDSYKDMQLMTYCKYHIIPNSTFGWWGGYLSQRDGKMMITPYGTLPGTMHF